MTNRVIEENKGLLTGLLVVLGVSAVATVFKTGAAKKKLAGKVKHACLQIHRRWLKEYIKEGGTKLILEFEFHDEKMKLRLKGFKDLDAKPVLNERLDTMKSECLDHNNVGYGFFEKDEKDNSSLHEIMAGDKENLTDWILVPVSYDSNNGYVCYLLINEQKASYKINPCPPCS